MRAHAQKVIMTDDAIPIVVTTLRLISVDGAASKDDAMRAHAHLSIMPVMTDDVIMTITTKSDALNISFFGIFFHFFLFLNLLIFNRNFCF